MPRLRGAARQHRDFYGEDILRGAAIGGVTGAIAGGGIAAATGRRGSDILVGAAIGALAGAAIGGTAGYIQARQRQAQDQGALVQAVGGDLRNENRQLEATQLAFNQLVDCRVNTANRIRADVRSGRMSRDQGMALMTYQRDLMRRDVALAQAINQKIGTRGGEFDTAIETIAPGTKGTVQARRNAAAVPTTARVSTPIRIRPDGGAAQIGQLAPNERVTVRRPKAASRGSRPPPAWSASCPPVRWACAAWAARRQVSAVAAARMASSASWPRPTSRGATTSARACRTRTAWRRARASNSPGPEKVPIARRG